MISVELPDLDELREKIDPRVVEKALNSAVNKTANKARTFISKTVRQHYNVKAAKIKDNLTETRRKDPIVERVLIYTGGQVSLINFGAKKARVAGTKRKGASVIVKKSSGRKIIKGENKYGAFIATGKNGNTHVFMRETESRMPIRKLSGPSVAQMIGAAEMTKEIDQFVKAEMPKQIEHELDYFITKAGAK